MPKGVSIEDILVGNGETACRGMTVVVRLRMFLNRGDEVFSEYLKDRKTVIDLGKRDQIAGLRYGIEGMRAGGVRKLVISPHLAYGAYGAGDSVPPNAVMHCDVELLEVRPAGMRKPEDGPPGKKLHIFCPGEAAASIPRCQFDMQENGGGVAFVTIPVPGYGWRPARPRMAWLSYDIGETRRLFQEASALPDKFPGECLPDKSLWSDASEPGNGVTRDMATNTRCVTISIDGGGGRPLHYSIRHNSDAWLHSALRRTVSAWLERHI